MKNKSSLRLNHKLKRAVSSEGEVKILQKIESKKKNLNYLANQSNDVQVVYFYQSLTPLFSKYFDPEDLKKKKVLNFIALS